MTHLTSPTLTRGAPSSPPACAGGEDIKRRSFLVGGATLALGGCFDRPWYEENPKQKAFLDGLQALAKPALASNNPLRLEEAVKQSLALAGQVGAFTDWQGILRTIEGNAQKMAISIDIGPQVSLYAFNDWTLAMAGALAELFSTRSRDALPPLASMRRPAVAARCDEDATTLSAKIGSFFEPYGKS